MKNTLHDVDEKSSLVGVKNMAGAEVKVENLHWRPRSRVDPVFTALNLHVTPGECVLVTGASGSGKTTLLRAIAGMLGTTEPGELLGSVRVDGVETSANVGLLLQNPADAFVAHTAGRDVAFGLENRGVPLSEMWPRIRHTLTAVDFPYRTNRAITELSGGEAQRLALAGVLVMSPKLVLLDEPTSMLDRGAAASIRESVWSMVAESGATLILVEHQLSAWLPRMTRLVVLGERGNIIADGEPTSLCAQQGAVLSHLGVWVPGSMPFQEVEVSPELEVGPELCAPTVSVARGTVAIHALQVGVVKQVQASMGLSAPDLLSTRVLDNVTVELRAGEITAIVGASGAGKSTLTALLAGLEAPSSGVVTVGGQLRPKTDAREPSSWSSRELAQRVGWVPQNAELAIVGRTVRDDVLSTSRKLSLEETSSAARADGLLAALGLTTLAEADPHHLSSGELRRVALAGAVAHGPAVLVLDEPTVGLDRNAWAAVAGIIRSAQSSGVAVAVATHDPLLIKLANRTVTLAGGRVINQPLLAAIEGKEELTVSPDVERPSETATESTKPYGLIDRCGPLSILASGILLVIGSFFITSLPQAFAGIAVEFLVAPLILKTRKIMLRRLIPGILAVGSIAFSTWLLSEHQDPLIGVTAGLRVAFFVLPGAVLSGLITPSILGDHLGQVLHLPARPVIAATAALQQFESLTQQWQQLRRVRRVRGLGEARSPLSRAREVGSLSFALLIQSLRTAGRMAVAVEARGFSAPPLNGPKRTWAEPARWTRYDTILLAVVGIVTAGTALL